LIFSRNIQHKITPCGDTTIIFKYNDHQCSSNGTMARSIRLGKQRYFFERCPGLLEWPLNSPDLNPIDYLKRRVEKEVNKRVVKKNPVTVDIFFVK
jgi:hypothetical protein